MLPNHVPMLIGSVFAEMALAVSKRLGVAEGDVDIDTLGVMQQEGCAEEEIANGTDSPWCLAFTKEDLQGSFRLKKNINGIRYVTVAIMVVCYRPGADLRTGPINMDGEAGRQYRHSVKGADIIPVV